MNNVRSSLADGCDLVDGYTTLSPFGFHHILIEGDLTMGDEIIFEVIGLYGTIANGFGDEEGVDLK